MMKNVALVVASASLLAACASTYSHTPVPLQGQTVRYLQGQPTTLSEGRNSTLQVTPLGYNDAGRLAYALAVYNKSSVQSNFGVENVSATALGAPVRIFTYAELERQAKNQATWAAVAVALSGASAAYAASSGPTSTSTTYTPYGTYRTETTNRALQSAMVGAAAAGTAVSMREISQNLDNTLITLQNNVIQTTTVDPWSSYGGKIITDRVRQPTTTAVQAGLIVNWNGEIHEFQWNITKDQ